MSYFKATGALGAIRVRDAVRAAKRRNAIRATGNYASVGAETAPRLAPTDAMSKTAILTQAPTTAVHTVVASPKLDMPITPDTVAPRTSVTTQTVPVTTTTPRLLTVTTPEERMMAKETTFVDLLAQREARAYVNDIVSGEGSKAVPGKGGGGGGEIEDFGPLPISPQITPLPALDLGSSSSGSAWLLWGVLVVGVAYLATKK